MQSIPTDFNGSRIYYEIIKNPKHERTHPIDINVLPFILRPVFEADSRHISDIFKYGEREPKLPYSEAISAVDEANTQRFLSARLVAQDIVKRNSTLFKRLFGINDSIRKCVADNKASLNTLENLENEYGSIKQAIEAIDDSNKIQHRDIEVSEIIDEVCVLTHSPDGYVDFQMKKLTPLYYEWNTSMHSNTYQYYMIYELEVNGKRITVKPRNPKLDSQCVDVEDLFTMTSLSNTYSKGLPDGVLTVDGNSIVFYGTMDALDAVEQYRSRLINKLDTVEKSIDLIYKQSWATDRIPR